MLKLVTVTTGITDFTAALCTYTYTNADGYPGFMILVSLIVLNKVLSYKNVPR